MIRAIAASAPSIDPYDVQERSLSDDNMTRRRRKPSNTAPAKLAYSSDEDEDSVLLKVVLTDKVGILNVTMDFTQSPEIAIAWQTLCLQVAFP